jgi:EmrB/QacA subfamily drug resistance transporter
MADGDLAALTATKRPAISPRTRLAASIVACALFMQNLDSTVIATALPTMARALGADPVHMSAALTAYLIALAAFIPASGWIADRYGTKRVFCAAIAVFTLGSILCGLAGSLGFLIASRILQGMGGAMMVPVGRLVLLRTAERHELVAAMAWLSMPALMGPVIGPPLGGLIVTYASWRWIFDINIPIGVLGIVLTWLYIADVREKRMPPFDFRGFVLSAVAFAGVMFGFETVGRGVVPGWLTWGVAGCGVVSGVLYAVHARRWPAPLLDFGLMRSRSFAVSVCAGFLFRIGIGAIPFLLPLMLQLGFHFSPAQSGAITFVSSAGAIVMKPLATRVLGRFGFRNTLFVNGLLAAGFLAMSAAFRPAWPIAAIYAVLLLGGFCRSLQFTAYNTIAYGDVDRAHMSAATSLYSTLQQVSLTVGVTAGAAALEVAMLLSGHAAPGLADFSAAFLTVALVSLFAAPLSLGLRKDAGRDLVG